MMKECMSDCFYRSCVIDTQNKFFSTHVYCLETCLRMLLFSLKIEESCIFRCATKGKRRHQIHSCLLYMWFIQLELWFIFHMSILSNELLQKVSDILHCWYFTLSLRRQSFSHVKCVHVCARGVLCVITLWKIYHWWTYDRSTSQRAMLPIRGEALVGIYPLTAFGRSAAQMSSESR